MAVQSSCGRRWKATTAYPCKHHLKLNQDRLPEVFLLGQALDVIADVMLSALPLSVLYVL